MTLTFNYKRSRSFSYKMVENITFLSKNVRFYLLIRNDKSLRVNKTPNLNDNVRQMNTFSADIHGYIASISFK